MLCLFLILDVLRDIITHHWPILDYREPGNFVIVSEEMNIWLKTAGSRSSSRNTSLPTITEGRYHYG
jgi:hypothetical protein